MMRGGGGTIPPKLYQANAIVIKKFKKAKTQCKISQVLHPKKFAEKKGCPSPPPPFLPPLKKIKSPALALLHEIIMHGKDNSHHVQVHSLTVNVRCNMPSQYFDQWEIS